MHRNDPNILTAEHRHRSNLRRMVRVAYHWFRGQGYGAVIALSLARAEVAAQEDGCEWLWEDDWGGWDGVRAEQRGRNPGPAPSTVEGCILYGPAPEGMDSLRPVLASLWGIWDASPEYRRVVQAELALEGGYGQ